MLLNLVYIEHSRESRGSSLEVGAGMNSDVQNINLPIYPITWWSKNSCQRRKRGKRVISRISQWLKPNQRNEKLFENMGKETVCWGVTAGAHPPSLTWQDRATWLVSTLGERRWAPAVSPTEHELSQRAERI